MTSAESQTLVGGVLRSPFAHARIRRIDTSAAEAIEGVRAIVTASDFPEHAPFQQPGNDQDGLTDLFYHFIATKKVFYEGQPILAIAAEDDRTLQDALSAVDIEYAVLPHVINVQKAMEPDAPLLHEELVTQGIEPAPTQPSNIAKRIEATLGSAGEALAGADVVVAEEFTTEAVYSGGIALPYCQVDPLGQGRFKVSSDRVIADDSCASIAAMLGMSKEDIHFEWSGRVSIGEEGKHNPGHDSLASDQSIYLEPLALLLAQKSQRAVYMTMPREDVMLANGAVPGSYITMRLGADRSGNLVAAEVVVCMQAGAFPGGPVKQAIETVLACYQLPAYRVIVYDVVVNRPMVTHSPVSGAGGVAFALESLLDELARKLSICPLVLRRMNTKYVEESPVSAIGFDFAKVADTLDMAQSHPHFLMKLDENQGRGVAAGTALDAQGNVISYCTHICDVEVDNETGQVDILRYTAIQAAADRTDGLLDFSQESPVCNVKAAVTAGLGRALHEAYIFDENGKLKNTNFLDYRLPLACDMPAITVVNIEKKVTGTSHSCYATSSMLPPVAAVANAIADATSARITSLPMSPPLVLAETQRQKWKRRLRR